MFSGHRANLGKGGVGTGNAPDPATRGPPGPRKPPERAGSAAHTPVTDRWLGPAPEDPHSDPRGVTWRHPRARGGAGRLYLAGHPRTYHGHRAGGGCGASRAYAGTGTRPSLPPAFLSGLVIQGSPPPRRPAGLSAHVRPRPSAKPAGSRSFNA